MAFCRSSWSLESSLSRGQRLWLFSNTEVSAQGDNIKVTWKKVEQRRLQGMFYKLLKIVDLWRELWNNRVERGGGRCSVGEAASPLCLGRLFHMGQDTGRGVYDPTYNSCEEERDLKWEDLRTTTLVHTNCLNATQFCTPECTAQLFLLKQFVHSWKIHKKPNYCY